MTNVQEELTVALERRAETVAVQNHLDAILGHHSVIRFSNGKGVDPRRNRVLVVAASVVVLLGVGGLFWADRSRTQPAATSSTPTPVDTSPENATSVSTPALTPATIPAEFPSDVPRPDTFELMTYITFDNERVGWEFFDQRQPTDSVERCTEYASSFDPSWTATPKTDEHASVIYAQMLDNGQWQVGIYCINDGGYLVQVMPTNTSLPLTADTVPPTSAPATSLPETSPPGWVAPSATLPALTDVSSVVPPTVLGTGPTDWYRLQPDLDVAWYSDGGDQSMLCFRTPAGQDCQLDRFAPTASGGGPIGVRSVDDQLLVVTLDPASPVTVTFDNGQTVTRPFEVDEQIGWGVARVQMPPAGNPEGLSMLFETAQDGSSSSAPPMTTVPTSEPVPSVAG